MERAIKMITRYVVAVVFFKVTSLCLYSSEHWAYKAPKKVLVSAKGSEAIDVFIRDVMKRQGGRLKSKAPRHTLIRRLSWDLRGLPPSPEEVVEFTNDNSSDAWKRLINKFIESPHFGERMAQNWFDLARFADTSGYAADRTRNVWPYRDWVIESFNNNMPFDQFTIEQLAGDMLPGSTSEQKLATGFHRQAMQAKGNNPRKEEFRIKGIVDRLKTTGRTWLGLSLECAECHDHKYDPISQRDYYKIFAIFNNVPHLGSGYNTHGPRMKYIPKGTQKKIDAIRQSLADRIKSNEVQKFSLKDESLIGHWEKPQVMKSSEPFSETGDLTIVASIRTSKPIGNIASKYDWKSGQRSYVFGIGGEDSENGVPGHLFAWISEKSQAWSGAEIHGSFPVNDGKEHEVAVVFDAGNRLRLVVDGVVDNAAKIKGHVPKSIAISDRPLVIGAGYNNSPEPKSFPFNGTLKNVRMYRKAFKLPVSKEIEKLQLKLKGLVSKTIEVPVMEESSDSRETHILIRGDYKQKGDRVFPGIPKFLPQLPAKNKLNRLDFSRWLVSNKHPLTARVTVNYLWQHFFGTGIVATPADFGSKGEVPSSPELLDWLAVEFMQKGWNYKHMVRLIVSSGTYQQKSVGLSDSRSVFGLMPRMRLPAEQIRDQFLSASDLLDDRIGGPSVFPLQPEGFYEERGQNTAGNSNLTWKVSGPEDRYRKSMYVYWKRMALHPSFAAFDAPTRQVCVAKRTVSNTPQQALVTLNDPMFDECSRVIAENLSVYGKGKINEGLDHAFMECLGRIPNNEERIKFQALVKNDGWYSVCVVLLNLDEALTRE